MTLTLRSVTPADYPALAAFMAGTSARLPDADLLTYLLERVARGPDAVADLWCGDTRVGAALLVDTCDTVDDVADLSLFTAREGPPETARALLAWALDRAARSPRRALDLPLCPEIPLSAAYLEAQGFRLAYSTFEMERPAGAAPPPAPIPPGYVWAAYDDTRAAPYHEAVQAAFATVPGAFVAPLGVFRERARLLTPAPELLLTPAGEVAGFFRVERREEVGELVVVGRHPRFRGLQLGAALVARGLGALAGWDCVRWHLEVAAVNAAAQELYRRFGFTVTQATPVYRRLVRAAPEGLPSG